MKIEGTSSLNFVHKGVVETGRQNLKEAAKGAEENVLKPAEEKVFKNPEPSSLKGFQIDKLA